ncbi:hypothetical protein IL38_01350 [Actinopolyspora erythraea]|uniref:PPE family domain-containing protein n=1 Tax=Actinopolyspora erythraea TaxID=414996 RepID=A0ABR4X8K3_9ACTN|nr:hypothetical protein [Actinopolyspora erythraea]KGI83034.1 hypothetical protein IL38_01350 [Actinopolyspora erythraea]
MSSSVPMKCYASQAKDLRAKMAGTPDAAQLPTPSGQGSTALDVASQKFESIINTVDAALTKAEEAHEGRAAEIARSSVSAIKPVANNAADFCKSVQNSLDDQASTQHKTFQELPAEGGKLSDGRPAQMEPPDKNWADNTGVSDVPLMGWTSDYEEKQERYRATNEEANRVMAQYEEQTSSATQSLPEFKPPEDSDTDASRQADYGPGAGSVVAGSTFDSGAGSGSSVPASSSSAWTAGSGGLGGGSVGGGSYAPSGGSGVGGGSYTSQPPASSGSAWVNPSTGGSSGNGLPPGAVRGSDGTIYRQGPDGGWQRQNPYNGRWAPAPNGPPGVSGGGRAGGSGGVGGARGGDGYTGRSGGSGGLGGARGGGGGYAGRAGGLGGTGAGEPAGGRSGTGSFGPKGSGSTVAAGTNAAGGRGGGMRGAPMAGAGARQAGGEEEEHERPSWLVEDEDVFTNDMQRVAPPVLGETPYEQGR